MFSVLLSCLHAQVFRLHWQSILLQIKAATHVICRIESFFTKQRTYQRLLTFEIDYIQDSVTLQSKPVFRYTHNNSKPLSITAVPDRRKHLTIVWVQRNCSDYAKTIISEKVKRYAPPALHRMAYLLIF